VRRAKLRRSLRHSGMLVLIAASVFAGTVGPLYAGLWDAALPAAIGSAVAALFLFAVAVNAPLEAVTYVALYFDRDIGERHPPRGFGRALYRESGRLDALAAEAGMRPLSEFESADPLDTRQAPGWHAPDAALRTVDHLLARIDCAEPLHAHLEYFRAALEAASQRGATFYLVLLTWGGGTNARVEAARRGELSVLRP
jgi:hypothetical protein